MPESPRGGGEEEEKMEGQEQTTLRELFGEPISVYTREQAIEDGNLVDLSQFSETQEAGFSVPVAMTSGAWSWVNPDRMPSCQDFHGRLWDVFTMFRDMVRRLHGRPMDRAMFSVLFSGGPGLRGMQRRRVDFVVVCGPGDNAEPVITIMLPGEE